MAQLICAYTLLLFNIIILIGHIMVNYNNLGYFCQLTVIAQILVILNFCLSLILHESKSNASIRLFLSRLHLITLSIQAVGIVGFWSLRIFFRQGIIRPGQQYTFLTEFLSLNVHGGSFLTMFYFVISDQIVSQTVKRKKYFFHMLWTLPYVFIQFLHWYFSSTHIYGFIGSFTWIQLFFFQFILYLFAVLFDYCFSIRQAYKILKSKNSNQDKNK